MSRPLGAPLPRSLTHAVAAYLLLGLVICFFRLGAGGVLLTEGMVAEAGRNMLATGDWVVPRMYGEPYTYKPPLAYWVAAAPLAVADGRPSEALLRLPFAAAAWLMGLGIVVVVGSMSSSKSAIVHCRLVASWLI